MIDFDTLIDNHLVRKFRPKPIGPYYPSGIGECLRKTWFSYKDPIAPQPQLLKIFQLGNMLHDFITDVLGSKKNTKIKLLESEMPIFVKQKDYVISGRIDNLALLKADDQKILIEVKSAKTLPEEPKLENIMQLQFYMYVTKTWDGALVYVQKDNLKTKTFHIKCRKETVKRIFKRFDTLHESLINNTPPTAEAKTNKNTCWGCNYCDWKEKCDQID